MKGLRNSRLGALALSASVSLLTVGFPGVASAQTEAPPAPSAPRSVNFPQPVERTLKNGLRVVAVERKGVPVVSARLIIRSGAETDPDKMAGLANLTASLLTKGTQKRSAPQIAEAMEALGGSIDTGAGWDSSNAFITVMSARVEPAMEILSDVVRNANFADDEIDRYKQQTLDELNVALSQPGTLAPLVGARIVYGDAPYGHPVNGTPESLSGIKREDVVKMHTAYYRPDNAILVVGGAIAPDAAFKIAEKYFGSWAKPSAALPALVDGAEGLDAKAKPRVVVVDKPDAGQAAVMVVRPGLKRTDPDYFKALVANSVLGGSYSARLNQEIRIKRGLSYGARSGFDLRRSTGPFFALTQTKNESGAEVASLLMAEVTRLAEGDLPNDEITPRKATLSGGFARGLETTAGLVQTIGAYALFGSDLNTANTYIDSVQKISSADVRSFAGSRVSAKGANIVIVGNASAFLDALKKQFPNVEVIAESDLDLNSATLKKQN